MWITSSGLSINPTKGSLLIISRSRTKPQLSITINTNLVTVVESVKYLGVTITSMTSMKWNTHDTNTCKSAKQKLGLLYRNFQLADQKTLSQLYKALVLPKLDYCSCVWDPPSITLSNKLESIQGFAAKLCTKRWSVPSTLVTSDLNWPTIRSRRSRQKVLLCRRIIRNESIISPSSYFSPPPHPNPRTHLPHTVHAPFARTTSFQSSFFVSVCNLWNSLPEEVVSLPSSRSFKAALLQLPSFSL